MLLTIIILISLAAAAWMLAILREIELAEQQCLELHRKSRALGSASVPASPAREGGARRSARAATLQPKPWPPIIACRECSSPRFKDQPCWHCSNQAAAAAISLTHRSNPSGPSDSSPLAPRPSALASPLP